MNSRPFRIIISGGGTGGHIYPAIAIAHALKEINPLTEILFVGAEGKMEMEKVPKAGYPIIGLPITGIQRNFSLSNLILPFKLVKSLWKAWSVIRDFRPDAAVGVGGFASGPLLLMASLRGIPLLIQEQNAHAGITNKLLARKASRICVAYPGMEKYFPAAKILLTGNPVRSDIIRLEGKKETGLRHFSLSPSRKTLFVMGGSLGARSINESTAAQLGRIVAEGYQVLWQTGKAYAAEAQAIIAAAGWENHVRAADFIYEMDLAYAVADVVVSRAGALSVSEICLAGKPAILVPYPYAAEDHQTSNAQRLVQRQAALMIRDSDAPARLVESALELLANETLQQQLASNCRILAHPYAAKEIAEEILKLV